MIQDIVFTHTVFIPCGAEYCFLLDELFFCGCSSTCCGVSTCIMTANISRTYRFLVAVATVISTVILFTTCSTTYSSFPTTVTTRRATTVSTTNNFLCWFVM